MNRKIRIVQIIPNIEVGGAEVVTINLVKALIDFNFDVTLVSLYEPSPQSLLWMIRDTSVSLHTLNKQVGFDFRIPGRLAKIVNQINPDVIHTHLRALKYTFLALLGNTKPVWIHTVHNIAAKENTQAERQILRHLCRTNRVTPVAVSKIVQKSFFHYYKLPRCNVIHNGIPIKFSADKISLSRYDHRHRLSIPERDFVILTVCRITQQKNPLLLLRAFNKVQQRINASTLIYAGDGPLKNVLIDEVNNLGLKKNVRILGNIRDVQALMKASDVFVLPSSWEGLPLSLLEAMNNAMPVIATSVGGVPEVIDNKVNGYLVEPTDEKNMADLLIALASNPRLRKEIGQRALTKVKGQFSIERMARSYAELYHEQLHKERG